jgi:hypothetical protein
MPRYVRSALERKLSVIANESKKRSAAFGLRKQAEVYSGRLNGANARFPITLNQVLHLCTYSS